MKPTTLLKHTSLWIRDVSLHYRPKWRHLGTAAIYFIMIKTKSIPLAYMRTFGGIFSARANCANIDTFLQNYILLESEISRRTSFGTLADPQLITMPEKVWELRINTYWKRHLFDSVTVNDCKNSTNVKFAVSMQYTASSRMQEYFVWVQ